MNKEMPEEIWIGDIEGSHCRCWNGPTYGGFKGEGHLSTRYIRADLVQAPQWRPIETAPRDQRVLVWSGAELYAAHWAKNPFTDDEAWIIAEWGDKGEQALVRPTHWMPLPLPPAPEAEDADRG